MGHGAIEIACPDKIETRQTISAVPDPKTWLVYEDPADHQNSLAGFQVFDGHPKDHRSLVPTGLDRGKSPFWENKTINGFWISCFYHQSNIRLTRSISNSVKKCTTKYQKNSGVARKIAQALVCE